MTVLSDLLFNDSRNEQYLSVAKYYYDFWTLQTNIKRLIDIPITICSLCSGYDKRSIAVLGIYYDSMPFNSVMMLDAAAVTIMTLLNCVDDLEEIKKLVSVLNPDIIRNHYFMNICSQREKCINDWDVIEILKSLSMQIKNDAVDIRQYANLTKLLKNECLGTCNTYKTTYNETMARKQNTDSTPIYFISDEHTSLLQSTDLSNNTHNRIQIVCDILDIQI